MNNLQDETSPYLLDHADNPVQWYPWGDKALDKARKEGKPLLISVGYAACHWCHVMAHESFKDEDIANTMNENFINIKIDREERPDLDHYYQSALSHMGQHGGWPLTIFATPEGRPFWGGTYFPAKPMRGFPGFREVLHQISGTYLENPDQVQHNVAALDKALEQLGKNQPGPAGFMNADLLDEAATTLIRLVDAENGGLRGAPKFPNTGLLEILLRADSRAGHKGGDTANSVFHSLTIMAQGGIYDHLGGGFARYSVDEKWLVPHFEKMLYDNALILRLMSYSWARTGDPLFKQRVEETVLWALTHMRGAEIDGHAGFASTIDADSEGEEGRYYVWREEEIDEAVPDEDRDLFKRVYDVKPEGNWEGVTILNRLHHTDLLNTEEEARLARCRQYLLSRREERTPPARDDKILADWNGLMITALAIAGRIFGRPEWVREAVSAYRFITAHMMDHDTNRMTHNWRDGRPGHTGMLEDYANMMLAALSLYEANADAHYLEQLRAWGRVLEEDFLDMLSGGYFQSAKDGQDIPVRPKPVQDAATPGGNGTLVEVFAKLAVHDPRGPWQKRLDKQLEAFAGDLQQNLFGMSAFLNGLDTALRQRHITLSGNPGDAGFQALQSALVDYENPDLCVSIDTGDEERGAQAVICSRGTCRPPVDTADEVRQALT